MKISDKTINIIVTAVLGLMLATGGFFAQWAFARIEELPKIYQTKVECDKNTGRVERMLDEQQRLIIDGFKEVNRQLFDLARGKKERAERGTDGVLDRDTNFR